ncbi:hypothetical protein IAT40_008022 [Kwoniella sp. CBS 6097]
MTSDDPSSVAGTMPFQPSTAPGQPCNTTVATSTARDATMRSTGGKSDLYTLPVELKCTIKCSAQRKPGSRSRCILDVRSGQPYVTEHQSDIHVESIVPLKGMGKGQRPFTADDWDQVLTGKQGERELYSSLKDQQYTTSLNNPYKLRYVKCSTHAPLLESEKEKGLVKTGQRDPQQLVSSSSQVPNHRGKSKCSCREGPGSFLISHRAASDLRDQVRSEHEKKGTEACKDGRIFTVQGTIAWIHHPGIESNCAREHATSECTGNADISSKAIASSTSLGETNASGVPFGYSQLSGQALPSRTETMRESQSNAGDDSPESGIYLGYGFLQESSETGETRQGTDT